MNSDAVALIMDGHAAVDIALSMYTDEPCRICGRLLTWEDLKAGAVFAGYSEKFPGSRAAHKRCWDGMLDTMGDKPDG